MFSLIVTAIYMAVSIRENIDKQSISFQKKIGKHDDYTMIMHEKHGREKTLFLEYNGIVPLYGTQYTAEIKFFSLITRQQFLIVQ